MIKNRLGFSFALPIMIGGVLLTLAGAISVIENPIIGIIMFLIGPFFWSSSYGFQININQKKFREYGSIYGIKKGKWHSLDSTPFISVLKGKSGTKIYSMSNRSTVDLDDYYEVCLLNKSQRIRFVVQKFDSKELAIKYAEQISSKLDKRIVEFNPQLSEKTRKRRMGKR